MNDIMDDVAALVAAIKQIGANWESGNLGSSVKDAVQLADTLAQEYNFPPYEQPE